MRECKARESRLRSGGKPTLAINHPLLRCDLRAVLTIILRGFTPLDGGTASVAGAFHEGKEGGRATPTEDGVPVVLSDFVRGGGRFYKYTTRRSFAILEPKWQRKAKDRHMIIG